MKHRRALAVLAATTAVAAPVAASAGSPAHTAASKNIVQIASSDPQFSTLVKLVKQAGLAKTLSKGSYTVFAPTNAAFAKVPKKTLAALAKNKAKLKAVLLYHVVKGRVTAAQAMKLHSARTLEGKSLSIRVSGGKVIVGGATVVKPKIGRAHV